MNETMATIPEGFVRVTVQVPFLDLLGPFYQHGTGGDEVLGIRVEPRHCNLAGIAHGGMIAALADIATSRVVYHSQTTRLPTLTISLSSEFHGKAPLGCWLTAKGRVERKGSSVAFASAELFADGERIGRVSGVFKLLKRGTPLE